MKGAPTSQDRPLPAIMSRSPTSSDHEQIAHFQRS
jgi:hypothetical protein